MGAFERFDRAVPLTCGDAVMAGVSRTASRRPFGNPYGHPAPGTVAELRAVGAVVLRTDRDGALAVTGGGTGGEAGELYVARD